MWGFQSLGVDWRTMKVEKSHLFLKLFEFFSLSFSLTFFRCLKESEIKIFDNFQHPLKSSLRLRENKSSPEIFYVIESQKRKA